MIFSVQQRSPSRLRVLVAAPTRGLGAAALPCTYPRGPGTPPHVQPPSEMNGIGTFVQSASEEPPCNRAFTLDRSISGVAGFNKTSA